MTPNTQAHPLTRLVSSRTRRLAAVDRACSFIDDNLTRTIRLADLCSWTHTGARALEYGFRQTLGVSPFFYIRTKRLDLARRLLSTVCAQRTVTKTALDCGFGHLGQFAIDYRKSFGESPSTTLRATRTRMRLGKRSA
jgi:transcriptional regulator GlxA family with amidase domain